MKKRILSFVIILVMAVALLPTVSFAQTTSEFEDGCGMPEDPYLISTKEQLNNVRYYLGKCFKLVNDIEFCDEDFKEGGAFYNDGAGFLPIGDNNSSFTGTFDGNGFAIKNLYINSKNKYVGLFGYNKGVIKNLGIIGGDVRSDVSGETYIGAIVGRNVSSVFDCYNTSSVYAYYSGQSQCYIYAGGIAGDASSATIRNCYNTGKVTASNSLYETSSTRTYAGGISGYSSNTNVENCYNAGTITASDYSTATNTKSYTYAIEAYSGGIIGYNTSSSSTPTVIGCNNSGKVFAYSSTSGTAYSYAGGIVAYSGSPIKKCYNTGEIYGEAMSANSAYGSVNNYAGGITAYNTSRILESYNRGKVTVSVPTKTSKSPVIYAGGISGYATSTDILNCFNTGKIASDYTQMNAYLGGIVGTLSGNSGHYVENCYNVGDFSYQSSVQPGIKGITSSQTSKAINCYFLENEFDSTNYSGNAESCTAEQMKDQATFAEFDFEKTWKFDDDFSYPVLQNINFCHVYDDDCDTICNKCGEERNAPHYRSIRYNDTEHFDKCIVCRDQVDTQRHIFDNVCDTLCDHCGFTREPVHAYEQIFDNLEHYNQCVVCKDDKDIAEHSFDNDCDTTCNGCAYVRKTEHVWSEYLYNNDASAEADGTKTKTCSSCFETETITAEGTKIVYDSNLPFVTLNEAGNGVVVDMSSSWATRVYWGNIGSENIPYREFDADLRLLCGTDYFADYAPRDEKVYHFTKPGYYRFVLKCIKSVDENNNYVYTDTVYTFYYSGQTPAAVPSVELVDGNHVKINTNGNVIDKLYYGNIGDKNVPYSWFNDFWGKSLATKSFKSKYGLKNDTTVALATKGYYNFVICFNDANGVYQELVYTVYAENNIGIVKMIEDQPTAIVNVSDIDGSVSKMYWGYIGTEAKDITSYEEMLDACTTLEGVWTVKTGDTYNFAKKGYYGFVVTYTTTSLINGNENSLVTYDIIYIVENK